MHNLPIRIPFLGYLLYSKELILTDSLIMLMYTWFRIWAKGTNVLRKYGKAWLQPDECLHTRHRKPYIFGKRKLSPFHKCIVFQGYYGTTHLAVVFIYPIFPKFPSTLVPFSLIRNHMSISNIDEYIIKFESSILLHCIMQGLSGRFTGTSFFRVISCILSKVKRYPTYSSKNKFLSKVQSNEYFDY